MFAIVRHCLYRGAFLVAEVLPLFATEASCLAADVHSLPATEVPFVLGVTVCVRVLDVYA